MKPGRAPDLIVMACLLGVVAVQLPSGIRFGDGLEFVAVSAHLGVAHPPGYPLFTMLGWLALKALPCAEPYDSVLWVCKAAAFACAAGLYFWVKLILARLDALAGGPVIAGMIAGMIATIFLFSGALWPTQHVVEIYGLNAAFLVWIGYALARADEARPVAVRFLLLAGLLLGLSLGNHITSACMGPVLLAAAWQFGRRRSWRVAWAVVVVATIVPVLLYGSLIIRVPGEHVAGIAWGATTNLGSLLHHMSGGGYGAGRILMDDVGIPFTFGTWLPFAASRVALVVHALGEIVLGEVVLNGGGFAWFAGIALAALAVLGLRTRTANHQPAVARGIAVAALLQLGFILVFNVSDIADYVLGVVVLSVPFALTGAVAVMRMPRMEPLRRTGGRGAVVGLAVLLTASVTTNMSAAFPPERAIPSRWLSRLLAELPEGAALVTVDDSDMNAMWYTQMARGERRDLAVFGANFLGSAWFRQSMPPGDPRRTVVGFRSSQAKSLDAYLASLRDLVLEPLRAAGGRVFTTMYAPTGIAALRRWYDVRHVADLLTPGEREVLRGAATGGLYHGPPVLMEITAKR